ncbi:MAG: glycine cleavage system protein GcvH [Candidatus Nezhaarchaeota archaeon]|nr:glycine cleavage system protein GcvH [Candidatus Nezhaarchaeota archaeon]
MVTVGEYEVLEGLYYSENHVWVKVEGNRAKVGLTDYAQKNLKQVINVSLLDPGSSVSAGEPFGSAESLKAAVDLISPLTGVIREVNREVQENPGLINEDPYGRGWLVVIEAAKLEEELKNLMTAEKCADWLKTIA